MSKKKPKSHPSHSNDGDAKQNLRSIFPKEWKISKADDIDSGIEYGIDWIIHLVDESDSVTGAMFAVQSKATKTKIKGRRIGMKMKVSTLNYLHDASLLVMLHYYHQPSDTGYWMWLDEYYQENYRQEWEQKDKVQVYIPTQNVLDQNSVIEIVKRVSWQQRKQILMRNADLASRKDEHYRFEFRSDHKRYGFSVFPKHPNAHQESPINFAFTFTDLDKFKGAIETGNKVELEGKITRFPKQLGWFQDLDVGRQWMLTLIPRTPNREVPLRIEFCDENDNLLFLSPYVLMKLIKQGTIISELEGIPNDQPIKYVISTNAELRKLSFNISLILEWENASATYIRHWIDIWNQISHNATYFVLRDLHNPEKELVRQSIGNVLPEYPIDEIERRYLDAIVTIEEKLNVQNPLPNMISDELLTHVELIARILVDGVYHNLYDLGVNQEMIACGLKLPQARELLRILREEGHLCVRYSLDEFSATLFNQKLQLGHVEFVFYCSEILCEDIIHSALVSDDFDDNCGVYFPLVIDVDASYIRFLDWVNDSD